MILASLLTLILPLGIGLAGLFAAILAHRGQPSSASWTLLISSLVYILTTILIGAGQYLVFSIVSTGISSTGKTDWDIYEVILMAGLSILALSLLGYAFGVYFLGNQWERLSKEAADLETLAQQLATQRGQQL